MPKKRTKDQAVRAATAAIVGPALIYAGYRFPGSAGARGLLMLLGAALSWENYRAFSEDSNGEEEAPQLEGAPPLGTLPA